MPITYKGKIVIGNKDLGVLDIYVRSGLLIEYSKLWKLFSDSVIRSVSIDGRMGIDTVKMYKVGRQGLDMVVVSGNEINGNNWCNGLQVKYQEGH